MKRFILAIKHLTLLNLFSLAVCELAACGPSPWSHYVKEGHLNPGLEKVNETCPLLTKTQLTWVKGPLVNEESEFQFTLTETPNFDLAVELYMPSMGHGSAPVKISPIGDLNYHVSNVYFLMHGLWEIRFKSGPNTVCAFEVNL